MPLPYKFLRVVNVNDNTSGFIYPGVSGDGRLVDEPWDHGFREIGEAVAVEVTTVDSNLEAMEETFDIELKVFLTDSRLVFFCKQYDKGSQWIGLGILPLILTAASKARAAKRTAGTVLIGHIRYEWLKQVGFFMKKGVTGYSNLGLLFKDTEGSEWVVTLNFHRKYDTNVMANEILRKAAKYKLAMNDGKEAFGKPVSSGYAKGRKIIIEDAKKPSFSEVLEAYPAPEGRQYRPGVFTSQDSSSQGIVQKPVAMVQNVQHGTITGLSGMYAGAVFPLPAGEKLILGRDASLCNIIINDDTEIISRKHMSVHYDQTNGYYIVTDHSRYGLFLADGTRLIKDAQIVLMPGAIVFLANTNNSFRVG